MKAEKTKLAEKIKVMEQRIKTLEETNRIPVPESAESVSEKMTKFKARLAKYKEFELVPYERRTE
ncbi:MAG: hypothetical protein WC840_02285 [Candidatus Peribacteraceae bacterium]